MRTLPLTRTPLRAVLPWCVRSRFRWDFYRILPRFTQALLYKYEAGNTDEEVSEKLYSPTSEKLLFRLPILYYSSSTTPSPSARSSYNHPKTLNLRDARSLHSLVYEQISTIAMDLRLCSARTVLHIDPLLSKHVISITTRLSWLIPIRRSQGTRYPEIRC